ncbi:MAG: hypothetical protein ACI8RZ_002041 [Myxococcota bacterium]|jgi:hypothetical protein
MHLIPLLLGCSGDPTDSSTPDTTDSGTVADTDTDTDTDTIVDVPDGTYGQAPSESLSAPEFAATNYDGGARGITDLTDGPTVMWFFPAAGTYG